MTQATQVKGLIPMDSWTNKNMYAINAIQGALYKSIWKMVNCLVNN